MVATRLEQRLFRDILAETMDFEEGQKALADPTAWKLQMKGFKNLNRYRTDYVETPRATIHWEWTKHRNAAGYFIGYRMVVDKDGKETKDQFIGRRTKNRLAAFLKGKAAALKAKHPNQAELAAAKRAAVKREQDKKRTIPRFSPKEFHLYCTIIDKEGKKAQRTHRVGAYDSPAAAKAEAVKDDKSTPWSLRQKHDRIYRLYRAKWTKADLDAFTL